jgi:hypothetical protein
MNYDIDLKSQVIARTKSLKTTFTIILIILAIILVIGVVLAIIFYIEYNNAVKDESPLCLTGSCAKQSKSCGLIPFTFENNEFVCKTDLFTSRAPNVTTTSN